MRDYNILLSQRREIDMRSKVKKPLRGKGAQYNRAKEKRFFKRDSSL